MKSFKQFVKESGNAIEKVVAIEQKYIPDTINSLEKNIFKPLGLLKRGDHWDLIGSALKKSTPSGDLDIAIDVKPIAKKFEISLDNLKEVQNQIEKIINSKKINYTFSAGINVFSFGYPIQGSEGNVQIDLMLTYDLNFTVWKYWSPSESESKYKGHYRALLISTIASTLNKKILKSFDDGDDMEIERYTLSDKGFRKKVESFLSKAGNKVKSSRVLSQELVTKIPEKIIKIILGPDSKIEDTVSFEKLWDFINSNKFEHKEKLPEIIKKINNYFDKNPELIKPKELK
jgi:hypothetical protein